MKKFYDKYSWLIILLLVLALVFLKKCDHQTEVTPHINLKPEIKSDLKKDVKLKDSVRIRDSVRITWLEKFKTDKTNPGKLPCDTFVKVIIADCDTVIQKDTLEIEALKKVVKQDSIVISDYQMQGNLDAQEISTLKKQLRNQKIKTKLILGAWVIREAVGIGEKIKN